MNRFAALACALALACIAPFASAQQYPSKPIRIIVPFPAGGLLDGLARGVGQKMSEGLGQPVIVEAKPGANTMIGAETVARSPGDGYTILFATDATVSINPLVYSKMAYDAKRDLVPVSIVAETVECILISSGVKANSVAELVALAKAQPGKLNYASFGPGSNAHLAAEQFKLATGVDMVHVPFKGVAEAMQALVAGDVQVLFTAQGAALPHIKSGKVKALAVMTDERQPTLPDVPTIAEAGLPTLHGGVWFGLMVPAGTPRDIVDRLARETQKAVAAPDVREKFITGIGLKPVGSNPEEFQKVLVADQEKYSKAVKAANLKLD
jgi:tripartite-type tricarboxylate transporter receptor subunit TctC